MRARVRQPNWLGLYRDDIARYRQYRGGASTLTIVLTEQGLWALLQYRIASAVFRSALPKAIKRPSLILLVAWRKLIEVTTGISLSCDARIGRGFLIWHFGNVFVSEGVEVGEMCSVAQGVNLGVSGQGADRGVPTLGDRVNVGANAVVVGKISVGDDATIAANSLVLQNVPAGAVVLGVPARTISIKCR